MNQETNFPFSLVIGEDKSTDRTREICLHYKKKYPKNIRLILNNENLGGLANFANAISHCSGKYVAICEGDDFWTNRNKLQRQVGFLEKHLDHGLVHGDFDVLADKDMTRSFNKANGIRIPDSNWFDMLLINNFICTATVCARTELVKDAIKSFGRKFFDWKMGDKPLWLEIAKHSKIGYMDEAFAVRRLLQESMQHTRDKRKKYRFLRSSYDVVFFFMDKYGCSIKTRRAVFTKYNRMRLRYAYLFHEERNAKEAFEFLQEFDNDKREKRANYYYYLGSKSIPNWLIFRILLKGESVRRRLLSRIRPGGQNEAYWFWD